jgi:phenylacetate-CoA ligase
LIYTTLTRDVMPLIRYRSSDVTQLVDRPCACGLFAGRLAKIRARADEMVVCGMGNIGPWVFEELLRGITVTGEEWQAVIGNNGRYDSIELRIERDEPDSPALERAVLDHLRRRFPDFWKNREMGLYELRIAAAAVGSLRNGRKLRQLVDERSLTARV